MASDTHDTSDYLVFDLGNETASGIVRSYRPEDERNPSVKLYTASGLGLREVVSEHGSTENLEPRQAPRRDFANMPGSQNSLSNSTGTPGPVGANENQTVVESLRVNAEPPMPTSPRFAQNEKGEVVEVQPSPKTGGDDEGWTSMATVGPSELYNDEGEKVVSVQEVIHTEADNAAASGYTRVMVGHDDDETNSITSLDERTDHLFDQDGDASNQIQTTRNMLSDKQRIAYSGLCRVVMAEMEKDLRKYVSGLPVESFQRWESQTTHRIYAHLGLTNDEQLMIEQLVPHGVLATDLAPSLRIDQTVLPSGDIIESTNSEDMKIDDMHADVTSNPQNLPKEKQEMQIDVRWTVLCDLFLNLVVDGIYDSRSRTMLENLAKTLDVSTLDICQFERKITDAMQIEEGSAQTWKEDEIIESRRKDQLRRKYAYIGLATLGGGLVIGLSAGLLAPVIGAGLAAGFTTIGIGGTTGFLAGAGGAALVTGTGVAIGAKVGHSGMARRMGHVKTFEFRPLHNKSRVNLIISVSGWMNGKEDDVRLPFSTVDPVIGDLLSVYWEPEMMQSMGQTINILATEALTQSVQQILGATILTGLMASLQLPMALSKLSYLLDNPWNVSLDRAWSAGLILADTLMQRNLGSRPVTLVGFSLGARVIYSCLVELARNHAYGLVQDALVFGAPVAFNQKDFRAARSVVSGRFVSGYSTKDWILGYLFRATSGGLSRVMGLSPINYDDVENLDCTELVDGHMAYRRAMPKLLDQCGWPVLSDEFDEINDPDPSHLREKQRKLIAELNDESGQPRKSNKFSKWFGFGGSKKKEWLTTAQKSEQSDGSDADATGETRDDAVFDIAALQAEVNRLEKMEPQMMFDIDDEPVRTDEREYTPKAPPSRPTIPAQTMARHHRTTSKSVNTVYSQHSVEMTFDGESTMPDDLEPPTLPPAPSVSHDPLADIEVPSMPHSSTTSLRTRHEEVPDIEVSMTFM